MRCCCRWYSGSCSRFEHRALPVEHRMAGAYKWLAWTMAGLVMAFGVYTAVTVP